MESLRKWLLATNDDVCLSDFISEESFEDEGEIECDTAVDETSCKKRGTAEMDVDAEGTPNPSGIYNG